jgi:hypothetical protein
MHNHLSLGVPLAEVSRGASNIEGAQLGCALVHFGASGRHLTMKFHHNVALTTAITLALGSALAALTPACSSTVALGPSDSGDVADATTQEMDGTTPPTPDAGPSPKDATTADGNLTEDATSPMRAAPVFLAAAAYADYLAIDPRFPFDVTQVHVTDTDVRNARWGEAGPIVAHDVNALSRYPLVAANGVLGASPTASISAARVVLESPPGLPPVCPMTGAKPDPCGAYFAPSFVEAAGLSLWTFTSTGANFPGQALLYKGNKVSASAFANSVYDLTAVKQGADTRLVYSAVGALTKTRDAANKGGIYVSDLCNGELAPSGACKSFQLLDLPGTASGPIDLAADGTVHTAFLAFGATDQDPSKVAVYALSKAELFGNGPAASRKPVAEFLASGSQSFAAITSADGPKWAIIKQYDDFMSGAKGPIDAAKLMGEAPIQGALKYGPKADNLDVFSDADGDLWVSVSTANQKGVFIELRRKP